VRKLRTSDRTRAAAQVALDRAVLQLREASGIGSERIGPGPCMRNQHSVPRALANPTRVDGAITQTCGFTAEVTRAALLVAPRAMAFTSSTLTGGAMTR
jgi:hypothetical protein